MREKAAASPTPEAARKYQILARRVFLARFFLEILLLVLFLSAGWSRPLRQALDVGGPAFVVNALYFSILAASGFCCLLPLSFYEGFVLEHRFGLSRQNSLSWFREMLKKGLISFTVSLILIEALYFFLSRAGRLWWIPTALFWFLISVVLAHAAPRLILPLFFKAYPLTVASLGERLARLFEQSRVPLRDVYVLDFSKKTVKANAMVAGLGSTKRIYLSDTLVKDFPENEIGAVVAHELGHYVRRDTLKLAGAGFVFSVVALFVADRALARLLPCLGFSAPDDIAALPLLLLVLAAAGVVLLPAQNAMSRRLETEADMFALRATGDPAAFVSMMRRLGERNLADPHPPLWAEIFLYDHPPLEKRIKLAESFRG